MTDENKTRRARRLPPWLKKRLGAPGASPDVHKLLDGLKLETVCSGAHCPNQAECFARGTATFLILGERCTRACGFCAIPVGQVCNLPSPVGQVCNLPSPVGQVCNLPSPSPSEPDRVAEACCRLQLRHVVITSVTRDDLPDGGAEHFANCVRAVRGRIPEAVIEVLTPDFQGDTAAADTVIAAGVDVFNHNVETVPRLYPKVRPEANYRRSLDLLAHAKLRWGGEDGRLQTCPTGELYTKSGLMVGLGETDDEISRVLRDLRAAACDIVTIGQYLAPSEKHLPVARFPTPEQFRLWQTEAEEMGFAAVAAGPFVRSSYNAGDLFDSRTR